MTYDEARVCSTSQHRLLKNATQIACEGALSHGCHAFTALARSESSWNGRETTELKNS